MLPPVDSRVPVFVAPLLICKAKGLVWVNTNTKVYHSGGDYYGKTKHGKFMTESDAKTAGFKPQDFMFDQAPARGGALSTLPTYDLSLGDLSRQVDLLTKQMDDRTEKLGILDSLMIVDSAKKKLLPSVLM